MCKFDIKVSVFAQKESKYPTETINLWNWLLSGNRYAAVVLQIRAAKNDEERRFLKSKLPAITPSGIFYKRRADCLTEPTNLICIDIDGKDNPSVSDMDELKKHLGKLPYIMYCGLSASGKGVFCIIPYSNYKNHKLHFNALEQGFKEMGVIVDSGCSDICRLRFYSYDEKPYVNPEAEKYVHIQEKTFVVKPNFCLRPGMEPFHAEKPFNSELALRSVMDELLLPTDLDRISAHSLNKTEKVERLLKQIIESRTDITVGYRNWFDICCIIKNLFDENGRELFHQVSRYYPGYCFDMADKLYSSISRWQYCYNSDRLFEIAAKCGK